MSWWFCGQSPIDVGLKGWMRKPLVILSKLKKVWMVPRSFLVKHLLIDSIFLLIFWKWKLYWKLSLESVGWVHDGSVPWRALTLLRRESCLLPNTHHSLDMLHIQHNSYIYLFHLIFCYVFYYILHVGNGWCFTMWEDFIHMICKFWYTAVCLSVVHGLFAHFSIGWFAKTLIVLSAKTVRLHNYSLVGRRNSL